VLPRDKTEPGKVAASRTNWVADPEAGGYYQALVDGTYAKYGLDVTILQDGPMSTRCMITGMILVLIDFSVCTLPPTMNV
jgi:ABC-type nitrate/sulfonate/bicarbonate transport system substrate-binding protein